MLIACKYEEIYPPQIRDYIHICDNAYNRDQITRMELNILSELDFNIDFVSTNAFLDRFEQMIKLPAHIRSMAQFLIEICFINYGLAHLPQSFLAIAAIHQGRVILNVTDQPMIDDLIDQSKYSASQIKQLGHELFRLLYDHLNSSNKLEALRKKFKQSTFHKVADFNFDFSIFESKSKIDSNAKSIATSDNKTRRGETTTTDKKKTISADKMMSTN